MKPNLTSQQPLRKVTMTEYLKSPQNFELRPGTVEGAPSCPYGNQYQWIGYDITHNEYVRFTKSVFKILINQQIK